MQRILLVEDEKSILDPLADFLKLQGYEVLCAVDGVDGLEMALHRQPDLVLLDLMLPGMDGFDVCRAVRAQGLTMPIIMLTAKGEESDKVAGLELGADDYVTKPFSVRELHARIRARLRRGNGQIEPIDTYAFGDVTVDFKTREVLKAGEPRQLAVMEFDLLRYLIEHRGEVVPRTQLLNDVWGYDRFPTTRTIDTHILNLRRKLETDPHNPDYFLTIHGVGYRFVG